MIKSIVMSCPLDLTVSFGEVVVANTAAGGGVGVDVDVDVVVDVDVGVECVVIAGADLELDEVLVGEGVSVLGEGHLSQVLAR